MRSASDWYLYKLYAEGFNDEKQTEFESLGKGGRYTIEQKLFAFGLIEESSIRAKAKILNISRRTLQRWCRKYNIHVKCCPDWVCGWAERRRKRREFWQRRGYY